MAQVKEAFISVDDRPPRTNLEETARKELGETEEVKKESLTEIRKLIREHKINCPSTDDFLLRFLRVRKFDPLRSFESLRNYSSQRALLQKDFMELKLEILETFFRLNIFGYLPYRDPDGRKIIVFRPGFWNTGISSPEEYLTANLMFATSGMEDETSQITGIVLLYDLESMSLSHWFHIARYIHRWRNFFFNCLPARYSFVHIISTSTLLKYVQRIVLPFLPKKIGNRVMFHKKGEETLFNYIPANILPNTFGGNLGPLNNDHIIKLMKDRMEKVKDEGRYFQQDS